MDAANTTLGLSRAETDALKALLEATPVEAASAVTPKILNESVDLSGRLLGFADTEAVGALATKEDINVLRASLTEYLQRIDENVLQLHETYRTTKVDINSLRTSIAGGFQSVKEDLSKAT